MTDAFHTHLFPELRDLVRASIGTRGQVALARTCRQAAGETLRWHAVCIGHHCKAASFAVHCVIAQDGYLESFSSQPQREYRLEDAVGKFLGMWRHVVTGRDYSFDESDLLHLYLGLPPPTTRVLTPWALDYLHERQAARAHSCHGRGDVRSDAAADR
jgi:hypothetical protein